MKLAASLALLATALVVTGCNTLIGVDNPDQREATFSNATGTLVTRYNTTDLDAVFNAVKRAVDSQTDMKRMGETPETGPNNELLGVTVFARAIGDLEIKIEVVKAEDPITKQAFTSVSVKYGFFGNLPQSQKLVSLISQNLRR
ncbi:DUF3568 family protein [bacterium]|jgi:Protein of unknown function (DUF3568)|nr:DUF3568 family protein [bacterium]